MGKFKDLTGNRIGRLTVQKRVGNHPKFKKKVRWECLCACGKKIITTSDALLRPKHIKSCGCWTREVTRMIFTRHGESRRHKSTPEYRIWQGMKARCFRVTNPAYPNYGGRGITMCERWANSFEAFLEDMGRRPSSRRSLDRIENDKGYEPGNCRWATPRTQSNNRRLFIYGKKLTYNEAKTIKSGIANGAFIPEGIYVKTGDLERQLATKFGVSFYTIRDIRLERLWKEVEVENA